MVATVLPPQNQALLPPPPPLDPSLVTPPPTTIYSGGAIPGQQAPPTVGATPAPVSTVTPGVQVAGVPPVSATSAMAKLSQVFKAKMGRDATPQDIQALLGGNTLPVAPGRAAGPPRGYQTLRGRESAAQVGLVQAQTGQIGTAQEIARGELELARTREARTGAEFLTGQTGYVGGGGRIFAKDIGIDITGIYDAAGKLVSVDRFNAAGEQAAEALQAAGMEPSRANITALLRGQSIQTPARMTLAGQKTIADITHDTARIQLAGREVTVGEKAQEWQKITDRAKLTGNFTDPDTGLSTRTLDAWGMQLQEAGVTGVYQGDPTFQAKMAEWDQTSRDKAIFGFERQNRDGSTTHVYGTNELQLAVQKNDQTFQKALQAGFDYVDEDGVTRHIKGQQELITDERTHQERVRTGYDEVVMGPDGRPARDGQGNLITRHIEGTQELQGRLADRTAELQEKGMNLEDAQRTAQREWDQRRYTGFYQARTVSLKDLGLETVIPPAARGSIDAFMQWASNPANSEAYHRLQAALGHQPTADEFDRLARGESVALTKAVSKTVNGQTVTTYEPIIDHIEGEAGLEVSRQQLQLTLQQNGIDADTARQVAEQSYQDKVRNGYFLVDEQGHRQRVRGTQEEQEYLTRLTAELNGNAQAAQRQFDEEQRVGYDKQMTNADGTVSVVHVQGTQEFAKAENDRTEELTKAGWRHEDAAARAAWENQEKSRTGYFKGQYNPNTGLYETVWQPGDEAHENELARLAREHDVTLQNARIAAAASESKLGRLHDRWLQNRAQQYQREGYNRADALAGANREWQTGENALERTLRTSLTQMELTASTNRLEAEGRMQFLAASITALSTLGAAGLKLLFDSSGKVSQFVSGIADGSITPANSQTRAIALGLTPENAQRLQDYYAAHPESQGGINDAYGYGGGAAGAIPIGAFGRWLTTPLGAGFTLAVVGGYATYRTMQWMNKEAQKDIDSLNSQQLKTFGRFFSGLSLPDQKQVQEFFSQRRAGTWNDNGTGLTPDLVDKNWGLKVTGDFFGAARDIMQAIGEGENRLPEIASYYRLLLDNKTFDKTVGQLTREERSRVDDLWALLPGTFRSVPFGKEGAVGYDDKMKDIATYGNTAGVKSTAELKKDLTDLSSAGVLAKDLTMLTTDEETKINQLYEQLGQYEYADAQGGKTSGISDFRDITLERRVETLRGLVSDGGAKLYTGNRAWVLWSENKAPGVGRTNAERARTAQIADSFKAVPIEHIQLVGMPPGGNTTSYRTNVEDRIRNGDYTVAVSDTGGGGKSYTVTDRNGQRIAAWWE